MSTSADELDAELATVIDEIEAMGIPEWHELSVESARRIEDELFTTGGGPEMEVVRDFAFDGPGGEVPIRVYSPSTDERLPTLVYYHGGGWVLGTLDSVENICRELAMRAECIVVSVDYRLAPRHTFPAAVDDAYAALEWVARNADVLGSDGRISVGGTSAGGNLAAVTALRVREQNGPDITRQLLLYPITDFAFDTDSYQANAGGPLLTRADMEWFWNRYLRSSVDGYNPFASPLRMNDLSGVAPATVVTAGFDPLRDEGAAYADRLANDGVDVEHLHYPTMAHGFLSLSDDVTVADEALDAVARSIE
ncbi:alpha/beta hydrolase [Haladaptatus salinisoli]|uniref:alpha/beta hydrolase n=1 Tax=Haladaptatus salinisoli TaxID=2884876 RepID=UPI001D0A6100|nr:alpha/beta hydrolase [Haladaptatus salinisoli]